MEDFTISGTNFSSYYKYIVEQLLVLVCWLLLKPFVGLFDSTNIVASFDGISPPSTQARARARRDFLSLSLYLHQTETCTKLCQFKNELDLNWAGLKMSLFKAESA